MSLCGDFAYALASCLTCWGKPTLRINRHGFRIIKLLGEGGFSYVYLVRAENGELYALKKIRCAFGQESIKSAMREIDNYKLFNSKSVIRLLESSMVQENDGTKTVYIVLPYYPNGNLQDRINNHLINNEHYEEKELIEMFLKICRAVQVMHKYRTSGPQSRTNLQDDDEMALLAEEEGNEQSEDTALDEFVPYAHRDVKPANIMLDDSNIPVLMDLGSCSRARLTLSTRQQALELQDLAAEHCTMPYRAPELFDVKTGSKVDERVDIWSLGCTFFALMYNSSPFELETAESGASLSLAIMNNQYKFPQYPEYSEQIKDLVSSCLVLEANERPFIDELIEKIEFLL